MSHSNKELRNNTSIDLPAAESSKLVAHESQFSSSVTLFSLDNLQGSIYEVKEEETMTNFSTPRRSKRIKLGCTPLSFGVKDEAIPDLEDLGIGTVTTSRLSLRRTNPVPSSSDDLSPLSSVPSSPEPPGRKGKSKGKAVARPDLQSPTAILSASGLPTKKKSQKAIPQGLDKPHPAPERWKEVYDAIKKMRENIVAPVDTMGCAQAQYKELEPKNQRFATLVSLMLSSQTKDEVTDAAVSNLRTALGGAVSVQGIVSAEPSVISEAIAKVGFWRRKTDYLKQAALKLRDEFNSDVPKTVDELCSLPGVGPKMAFLCLQAAWNLNHGIGVDVHVHRITNRLGWHRKPTKNAEETRLNLQSWLPSEYHQEINAMLVGFGQVICTAVNPKCDQCVLSGSSTVEALCPSARRSTVEKKKKTSTKRKLATTSLLKGEEKNDHDVKPGSKSGLRAVNIELEVKGGEERESMGNLQGMIKVEDNLIKTEKNS